jgi:hypothetical protein
VHYFDDASGKSWSGDKQGDDKREGKAADRHAAILRSSFAQHGCGAVKFRAVMLPQCADCDDEAPVCACVDWALAA